MAHIIINSLVLQNWQLPNPMVELRIGASQAFVTSDNVPIQPLPYYQAVTCTPDLVAKTLTIPQIPLNSTQDSIDNQFALYAFSFWSGPGAQAFPLGVYKFGMREQVFIPSTPSPTTFGQIEVANNQLLGAPPFNWSGAVNIGLQTLNTPVILADGDSTPFVGLRYNLITANTATTNITDFRGAYPGQIISLTINDTHTKVFGAPYGNGTLLYLQYINGAWRYISPTAGISSINGQTDPNQTLVTGSAGSDFNIQESGAQHIFNLPDAGATARGVVNTGQQTIAGHKTIPNLSSQFLEAGDAGNGQFGVLLTALPNDTVTGTVINKLCKLSGDKARIIATADVVGIIGVVQSGAGQSGSCRVAIGGIVTVAIDGPVVAGNYAVASITVAGAVSDAGGDIPATVQVVGQFASSAASGTALMLVLPASVSGGGGGGGDAAYDLQGQISGAPAASQIIYEFPSIRAFTLGLSASRGLAQIAATAQTDFIVTVNNVTKATLRFAAGATSATVLSPISGEVLPGNIVRIVAPASPDPTLANINFVLDATISNASVYDLTGSFDGAPGSSQTLYTFPVIRAATLPVTGSTAICRTAPTAQTDFLIKVGSTTIGTLRFAAGQTVATVVSPTTALLNPGDAVSIVAPASPDATIADLTFVLKGTAS